MMPSNRHDMRAQLGDLAIGRAEGLVKPGSDDCQFAPLEAGPRLYQFPPVGERHLSHKARVLPVSFPLPVQGERLGSVLGEDRFALRERDAEPLLPLGTSSLKNRFSKPCKAFLAGRVTTKPMAPKDVADALRGHCEPLGQLYRGFPGNEAGANLGVAFRLHNTL